MKTKEFKLSVKDLKDNGTFTGYGSVFGNVDSYGEAVMKGAFEKSLKKHEAENLPIVMLWQHDRTNPIGIWKNVHEDEYGLCGEGEINLDTQQGREAYSLMKQGALNGLSIGYREILASSKGNVRSLTELELYEISPVTFPANTEARITGIKSERIANFAEQLRLGNPPPPKEFEEILREAGFPKSMATQIVSVGYAKAIRRESESKNNNEIIAFFNAALNN